MFYFLTFYFLFSRLKCWQNINKTVSHFIQFAFLDMLLQLKTVAEHEHTVWDNFSNFHCNKKKIVGCNLLYCHLYTLSSLLDKDGNKKPHSLMKENVKDLMTQRLVYYLWTCLHKPSQTAGLCVPILSSGTFLSFKCKNNKSCSRIL